MTVIQLYTQLSSLRTELQKKVAEYIDFLKFRAKKSSKRIFSQVKEIHHGFRSITRSSVTAGFDVELLYLAAKDGFRIKEVPVDWLYVETRRVSPIKDSIDGLLDLIRIRKNIIRGVYSKHA